MIIVSTINPSSYRIYRTMTGCKRCTILAIGKSNALTVRGGCSSVKRGKRTMPSDINKQRELIDEWTGFAKVHLDRGQKRVADAYLECAHSLLAMLEGEEPECEWVSVEDRLPDKPNKAEYEYVDCWIFYKGQIMRIPWNCEERCWDDADYDDHFCAAKVPTHWMLAPLPAPPETEVKG